MEKSTSPVEQEHMVEPKVVEPKIIEAQPLESKAIQLEEIDSKGSNPKTRNAKVKMSEGRNPEAIEQQQRIERLRDSLYLLQLRQPRVLHELEKARLTDDGVTVGREGVEHDEETALALLRCAHAFMVPLTFVPEKVVRRARPARESEL